MAKENNNKSEPKEFEGQTSAQTLAKGNDASGEKADIKAKKKNKPKKLKKKLSEHTAFKNKEKPKKKSRQAVWVKKFTLEYEEELHKLQIELLKMQKYVKNEGLRIVALF